VPSIISHPSRRYRLLTGCLNQLWGGGEALRISFYKAVAAFVRAFAAIAQSLTEAGYSDAELVAVQKDVEFHGEIRAAIKKYSGEELNIKSDPAHCLSNTKSRYLRAFV